MMFEIVDQRGKVRDHINARRCVDALIEYAAKHGTKIWTFHSHNRRKVAYVGNNVVFSRRSKS